MFELGTAFLNAGLANFREGTIKNRSKYQNIAGFVNLAFACELFIKCLLNLAGQESKGHKLACLWTKYKSVCADDASEIKISVMNVLDADFTFEEMLQSDDNVFCNYRYFFEPDRLQDIQSNPLKPQFLRFFALALRAFLENKLKHEDGI